MGAFSAHSVSRNEIGRPPVDRGLLELEDDADLAGPQRVARLLLLALEVGDLADALARLPRRVVELAVRGQRPREDPEEGELAHMRVGERLEDERRGRVLRARRSAHRLLRARVDTLHRRPVGGRREGVHHELEERADPQHLRGRAAQDGHELARPDGRAQGLDHRPLVQGPLLQVAREQIIVGLRHRLHELLAVLARGVGEVVGDVRLVELSRGPALDVGLHLHQVDGAPEARLLPHRHLEGHEAPLEPTAHGLEGPFEVGPLPVHAVHEDESRELVLLGELRDLLRLHLDPRHRVDDDHRALDHAEPRPRLRDEVAVSGQVHEMEAVVPIVAEGDRGVDRDLALDLLGVEVRRGRAIVDLAPPARRPRPVEDRLDERGLAHPSVADEADVPDARDLDHHTASWVG